MSSVRRVLFLSLALIVLLPATAVAGGPGKWTRVTGADSWFELNLTRTSKLHVSVREQESASTYRLIHRSISGAGEVGEMHTVASGFEYIGYYPGLVQTQGVLRILFGSRAAGDPSSNSSMRYVDSTDGGATWSEPVLTAVTDSPGQAPSEMDAAANITTGETYQVWEGTGCICVQRGIRQQMVHTNFNDVGGNNADPSIAIDQATQKVWVSWMVFGNDVDGIYVREADVNGEPVGPSTLVPGSYDIFDGDRVINFQNGRVPMVERRGIWGGEGVYVAYRKGYPVANRVNVWPVGAEKAVTVAKTGKGVGEVALAADRKGRIWALWVSDGKVFARRSDPKVRNWGKIVRTKIPTGSVGTTTLQADAQNTKVDVLAYASKVDGSGFFHTQLRPGITFNASPSKLSGSTRVVFVTKDAGVPLAKSKVSAGGKSCTTNDDGRCSIVLGPYPSGQKLKAKATHAGYVPSALTLRAG